MSEVVKHFCLAAMSGTWSIFIAVIAIGFGFYPLLAVSGALALISAYYSNRYYRALYSEEVSC